MCKVLESQQNHHTCLCRMYKWECDWEISNPIHRSERFGNEGSSVFPERKPTGSTRHMRLRFYHQVTVDGQNRWNATAYRRKPRKCDIWNRFKLKKKKQPDFLLPSWADGAHGSCGNPSRRKADLWELVGAHGMVVRIVLWAYCGIQTCLIMLGN